MDEFQYVSSAQEVIFGAGALGRVGEAVERLGSRRLLLCTGQSMRASGHLAELEAVLGERLVVIFDHVLPHVQDLQVDEVAGLAAEKAVEAVVGMGGGSPLGMAKAVAAALSKRQYVPIVAIPTTYAGSEMTPTYGVTHTRESPARKVTVRDPQIVPRLVVYDPRLTFDLPGVMTASTGMNALAHCIEALYSRTQNPLSSAAASAAIGYIHSALLACYTNGNDPDARSRMLIGAHLAGLSLASVSMGLHHGLCHVLGGTANVPHGIANSIILPHAIRFNAQATAQQLLPAAVAMGISGPGKTPDLVIEALARAIFDLVGKMNLPQRLRDVGVKETDLPELARLGFENRNVQNNPKPIENAAQIEGLLREAW